MNYIGAGPGLLLSSFIQAVYLYQFIIHESVHLQILLLN